MASGKASPHQVRKTNIGLSRNLSMKRSVALESNSVCKKEATVAEIKIELPRAKREFDGQQYILTKINYTKEDAKEDQAYYEGQGRVVKNLEEDGFWLLYTKIGQ